MPSPAQVQALIAKACRLMRREASGEQTVSSGDFYACADELEAVLRESPRVHDVAVSADTSAETAENANELPRTLRESPRPHLEREDFRAGRDACLAEALKWEEDMRKHPAEAANAASAIREWRRTAERFQHAMDVRESPPPHPQTAERKRANVKPLIDEMRAIECGPCSEQNPSLAKRIGEWALKLEQAAASQPVGDSTPAPSPPNRYATSEEVKESAARMIVKHRKALEKLAKSDVAPEGKTVDASDER